MGSASTITNIIALGSRYSSIISHSYNNKIKEGELKTKMRKADFRKL
jgi:hypothetical protein